MQPPNRRRRPSNLPVSGVTPISVPLFGVPAGS
jgi:hypothetical protein